VQALASRIPSEVLLDMSDRQRFASSEDVDSKLTNPGASNFDSALLVSTNPVLCRDATDAPLPSSEGSAGHWNVASAAWMIGVRTGRISPP
jgi:hypothetical protein